ncbi:MFS general substrate transporter [Aspergillus granulosus]|uniref:MFS general substrate transporter n=1 Tax=Aspergillus granulosus TaxID=176169 RepID=A0ABR4GTG1_9EURO
MAPSGDKVDTLSSAQHVEVASKPTVRGDPQLIESGGEIHQIPIPSASPNDPLKFSSWKKLATIWSCCWFSIMSLSLVGSIGMILNRFIEIYLPQGYTMDQVTYLVTMPSLSVGLGNFIILPAALWIGRRPVFIACTVVLTAASVGAAFNNSYDAHLALRIVQGLAAGATESLLPLILSELTFLHQRPLVFSVYWGAQTCISSVLNIAITYVVDAAGWRWYYGLYAIVSGISIFFTFFLSFETRYSRPPAALNGQVVVTDDFGVTRVLCAGEASNYLAHHAPTPSEAATPEPKKSYSQLLNIWPGALPEGAKLVSMSYLHMLQSLSAPAIVYSVLVFSITLGCSIALSLTQDAVLHTLYGWPEKSIGLINVASPVVTVFAILYSGWFGGKATLWLAKRSSGIHKPEHHLLLIVFPGFVGLCGILLYGFGAAKGPQELSWMAPYMGWTLYQFTFITVSAILSTFATEVWPMHPGPALVVVVGLKSIIAFGAAYGLQPMVTLHGYDWGYGIMSLLAAVFAVILLVGVPVYFLNPKWRTLMSDGNMR